MTTMSSGPAGKRRGTPLWIKEQQEHAKMLAPPPFDLPRDQTSPRSKKDRRLPQDCEGQLEFSQAQIFSERWIRPTCKELGNGHTYEASINFCKRRSLNQLKWSEFDDDIEHLIGNGLLTGTPRLDSNVMEHLDDSQQNHAALSVSPPNTGRKDHVTQRNSVTEPIPDPLNSSRSRSQSSRYPPSNFETHIEIPDANSVANWSSSSFHDPCSFTSTNCASPRVTFATKNEDSDVISVQLHRQKSEYSKLNIARNHPKKTGSQPSINSGTEYFPAVAVRDTKLTSARKKKNKMGLVYDDLCHRGSSTDMRDEKGENMPGSKADTGNVMSPRTQVEKLEDKLLSKIKASQLTTYLDKDFIDLTSVNSFKTELAEDHDGASALFGEPGKCKWHHQKYRVADKQMMVEDLLPPSHAASTKHKTVSCGEKINPKIVPPINVTNYVLNNVDKIVKPVAINAKKAAAVTPRKGKLEPKILYQFNSQKIIPSCVHCDLNPIQYTDKQRRIMIKNAVRLFESISASVTQSPWKRKKDLAIDKKQLITLIPDDDVSEVSAYLA